MKQDGSSSSPARFGGTKNLTSATMLVEEFNGFYPNNEAQQLRMLPEILI